MHICIYVYTYMFTYIHIYIYTCMHICIFLYIHTGNEKETEVHVHQTLSHPAPHTHIYIYAYIYAYTYTYTFLHRKHKSDRILRMLETSFTQPPPIYIYAYICTYAHINIFINIFTQETKKRLSFTYVQDLFQLSIYKYMHTNEYIHKYIHTGNEKEIKFHVHRRPLPPSPTKSPPGLPVEQSEGGEGGGDEHSTPVFQTVDLSMKASIDAAR